MKINYLVYILIISFLFSVTFKLKDGTIINGEIISENETEIIVKTSFAELTIPKGDIITEIYRIVLKSGDVVIGEKYSENNDTVSINTSLGLLEISRTDIIEMNQVVEEDDKSPEYSNLPSLLFDKISTDKDRKFSSGDMETINLFFGPTANTLQKGTFYLSGLSFAFGINDNFMVSSRWANYFYGDANIRVKYKVFEKGNMDAKQNFSVGGHVHNRWAPDNWGDARYEWVEISANVNNTDHFDTWEEDGVWYSECHDEGWDPDGDVDCTDWSDEDRILYNGGFYTLSDGPDIHDWDVYDDDENDGSDDFFPMIELFTAYTITKSRGDLEGEIAHTFGANVQFVSHDIDDRTNLYYKLYYGIDVDLTSRIKMIGQVFYDPFHIPWWNREQYNDDSQSEPIEKPDLIPIHLDFGFLYSVSNSFRFGIHFQPTYIGFYWEI